MKKLRMTKRGMVLCPRRNEYVSVGVCINCDDVMGVLNLEKRVLCKRGLKKDEYIKKSKNIKT